MMPVFSRNHLVKNNSNYNSNNNSLKKTINSTFAEHNNEQDSRYFYKVETPQSNYNFKELATCKNALSTCDTSKKNLYTTFTITPIHSFTNKLSYSIKKNSTDRISNNHSSLKITESMIERKNTNKKSLNRSFDFSCEEDIYRFSSKHSYRFPNSSKLSFDFNRDEHSKNKNKNEESKNEDSHHYLRVNFQVNKNNSRSKSNFKLRRDDFMKYKNIFNPQEVKTLCPQLEKQGKKSFSKSGSFDESYKKVISGSTFPAENSNSQLERSRSSIRINVIFS